MNSLKLISLVSLSLVLFYNRSFFENVTKYYIVSAANLPFIISLGILLFLIHFLVMLFLDFPFILKIVLAPVFLLSSLAAYVMDNFHYMIDYQVYRIILETNYKEALEFINIYMLLYIFVLAVIPATLIMRMKINHMSLKSKLKYLICVFILLGANLGLMGKSYADFFRNHKPVRYFTNPITYIYSAVKFTKIQFKNSNIKFTQIGLDAKRDQSNISAKKKLVVLVVGETARSKNFSLNGYERKTNPLLEQIPELVSLKEVSSCGTETSKSLPCMFSKYTREDYTHHRGKYSENALDILKRVKVRTLWKDNDSGCKGVCDRIEYRDLNHADIKPHCKDKDCFDEVLLDGLQNYIDQATVDTIIVLHKKGNHGPAYYKRYPKKFEKFIPTCLTERLQDCETPLIVNAYDNIILYTDFFLDSLIKLLKANEGSYDTTMMYVSDHGESLGENGIYLHAMPYWIAPRVQTHIPFILWQGSEDQTSIQALAAKHRNDFSHDHLFHTLLGLFHVQTKEYKSHLDLFFHSKE